MARYHRSTLVLAASLGLWTAAAGIVSAEKVKYVPPSTAKTQTRQAQFDPRDCDSSPEIRRRCQQLAAGEKVEAEGRTRYALDNSTICGREPQLSICQKGRLLSLNKDGKRDPASQVAALRSVSETLGATANLHFASAEITGAPVR